MDGDRKRLDAMATLLRGQLSAEQGETARLTRVVEQLQSEVCGEWVSLRLHCGVVPLRLHCGVVSLRLHCGVVLVRLHCGVVLVRLHCGVVSLWLHWGMGPSS